jgi:high affinity Mn2+ porin
MDCFKRAGVATAVIACATAASAQVATNGVPVELAKDINPVPAPLPVTNAPPLVSPATPPGGPENWNFHAQNTDILQGYPAFSAQYTGPNSLPPGGQARESVSLDLMGGVRLWAGAEAHIDGLMWQGFGVNDTLGAEGFPNGEAFRLGTSVPNGSITRLFIRQTIGLGGEQEDIADDPVTLAGREDVSRLTFTVGRFSPKDIFDNNAYANDPRTEFMNWGLMANEAWDYPADAIGYTTGLSVELNQPKWTLRYGFFQMPRYPNNLTGDDRYLKWPFDGSAQDGPFMQSWGMVTELERRYAIGEHPGTVRLLAFLNRANMADYSAATAILLAGGPDADFEAARSFRYKYGFGLNWEQEIVKNVGVFSRLGWNDDREEGWVFSDVGHAASAGLSIKGAFWDRPDDTFGLGGALSGISKAEQEFFAAGGVGILAGDGNLDYGWEKVLETYYDCKVWKTVHAALDYQFIADPAFNRDRGPVSVFGGRVHWEF